ncbi:hypothetical protein HK099_008187 [Clydaea vesicula]|uniref:AAA+ ATPase domain-containing protein n=1 Tax=Clydaea vesicula TaxID=447962 RepID=A0AAD5TVM2_9FUNG|nr:hypothetical protein HK099_008187 [Clydaea vesicula]
MLSRKRLQQHSSESETSSDSNVHRKKSSFNCNLRPRKLTKNFRRSTRSCSTRANSSNFYSNDLLNNSSEFDKSDEFTKSAVFKKNNFYSNNDERNSKKSQSCRSFSNSLDVVLKGRKTRNSLGTAEFNLIENKIPNVNKNGFLGVQQVDASNKKAETIGSPSSSSISMISSDKAESLKYESNEELISSFEDNGDSFKDESDEEESVEHISDSGYKSRKRIRMQNKRKSRRNNSKKNYSSFFLPPTNSKEGKELKQLLDEELKISNSVSNNDNNNSSLNFSQIKKKNVENSEDEGEIEEEEFSILQLLQPIHSKMLQNSEDPAEKNFFENCKHYLIPKYKNLGLADIDPLNVEKVDFEQIGGFDEHIRTLKEMVTLPLLYPQVFKNFNVAAAKGVLFYGPPGTGKTLMARALASSCSSSTQTVNFFMRKGADILSKWIGESERQLRLLFEQAKTMQPSLAPVRSSKQDQIHSSIVSTLLALMDGLDSRGQVIVIGATNRIDAIDPALRRPGRFDREFYFGIPSLHARKKIIEIATTTWNPQLPKSLIQDIAKKTTGYCGADIKALCTEAVLTAIRRTYPEIYENYDKKYIIDASNIAVSRNDFNESMKKLIPSTKRSGSLNSMCWFPLPPELKPLLSQKIKEIIPYVETLCKILLSKKEENKLLIDNDTLIQNDYHYFTLFHPIVLISGEFGSGHKTSNEVIIIATVECSVNILPSDLKILLCTSCLKKNDTHFLETKNFDISVKPTLFEREEFFHSMFSKIRNLNKKKDEVVVINPKRVLKEVSNPPPKLINDNAAKKYLETFDKDTLNTINSKLLEALMTLNIKKNFGSKKNLPEENCIDEEFIVIEKFYEKFNAIKKKINGLEYFTWNDWYEDLEFLIEEVKLSLNLIANQKFHLMVSKILPTAYETKNTISKHYRFRGQELKKRRDFLNKFNCEENLTNLKENSSTEIYHENDENVTIQTLKNVTDADVVITENKKKFTDKISFDNYVDKNLTLEETKYLSLKNNILSLTENKSVYQLEKISRILSSVLIKYEFVHDRNMVYEVI